MSSGLEVLSKKSICCREIDRLESLLDKEKIEHGAQLRSLRHQLANTAMEKHQHDTSNTQLEQLLADTRRENKLLKDEVYDLKATLGTLQREKVFLTTIIYYTNSFIWWLTEFIRNDCQ